MLRAVQQGDAKQVAEVLRESFNEYAGRLDPPSGALSETEESIIEKLRTSQAFVIESDGGIVACVFCQVQGEDFYLSRLGVLPRYRRQGLAQRLIEKVEERAHEIGVSRVRLGTRLANPRNIEYYKRLGYEHVSEGVHPQTGIAFYAVMVKEMPRSLGESTPPRNTDCTSSADREDAQRPPHP